MNGALSSHAGTVSIGWRIDAEGEEQRGVLTWVESGGPAVTAPDRAGQGTRFIKGSIRHELRGDANLDFQPEGLRATISFALKATATGGDAVSPREERTHAAD